MTVRVTQLPSGLRVVTDAMTTVETVTFGAWVGIGTRHETEAVSGVSHFLEHMAFKGTRKRSARAIAEEIEAVGGHINAHTSREYTAFHAKVLREDVALAVDMIADILQHSILAPEEIERERTVILQEIGQAHDTPDDIIFDYFQETAYPGQALGRSILGSAGRVRTLPRETILGYMRAHYGPAATVVAAAGRIDHDWLVALVDKTFDALPGTEPARAEPSAYRGGEFRRARELEQAHILLGFDGIGALDDDFFAASVFSTLFGGGMSSRLFQEVREKRGLVYDIYSFMSCYADGGLFGVYAGTSAGDADQAIDLIAAEIVRAADDLGEGEIARARAQLKASILMGLESTTARCEQAARQLMLFGRPIPPEEIVARVEAADRPAIQRIARRLTASAPTLTLLGPIARVQDYTKIAERLKG
ncbi:MAG: insulinase family protein [Rhodospirillales bacterium]|nr:insulinase family protein [Rhodospirillales bacterium]